MLLPYLHIPISLPGAQPEGDDPSKHDKVVTARILPQHVQFYHEGHSWGTFIYMQCGHALCSTLTVEQYEKAIKDYWAEVEKPINKNKLRLLQ
jgi:hypothetical protein